MRIAIAQLHLESSRAQNQRQALELIARTADMDPVPDVVCLPGRCDCGMVSDPAEQISAAMSDSFVEVLGSKARDMGISLVVGFSETDGRRLYDAAAWIDADGDILLKHRRISIGPDEQQLFARGQAIKVCDTLFGTISVVVGRDAGNASILDTAAQLGARVVFAPVLFSDPGSCCQGVAEVAANKGLHVVLANSGGPAGGAGHSCIIAPNGERICQSSSDEETLLYGDVHLEE